mgnify:CR=1 FL=1
MAKQNYWKVSEIAKEFRLNHNTVYKWIQSGELPAIKLGAHSFRVADEDLKAFIRRSRY